MLNDLKRKEAKVRGQHNEMMNMQRTGSSRASSANPNRRGGDSNETLNAEGQAKQRGQSAARYSQADLQKEEEQDKAKIEQLKVS